MTRLLRAFALLALVAALPLGLATGTGAQMSLDGAKAAGLVGERPDGLVGVVDPGAGADVVGLVDAVNRQRLAHYAEIAAANASTVEQVQAVAGAQLIERTPSGLYVMDASGRWFVK
ncbi:MAG: YdbL family protein [Alphaproteobacteria bacterium]